MSENTSFSYPIFEPIGHPIEQLDTRINLNEQPQAVQNALRAIWTISTILCPTDLNTDAEFNVPWEKVAESAYVDGQTSKDIVTMVDIGQETGVKYNNTFKIKRIRDTDKPGIVSFEISIVTNETRHTLALSETKHGTSQQTNAATTSFTLRKTHDGLVEIPQTVKIVNEVQADNRGNNWYDKSQQFEANEEPLAASHINTALMFMALGLNLPYAVGDLCLVP